MKCKINLKPSDIKMALVMNEMQDTPESIAHMKQSFKHHLKKGLSYNQCTGKTSIGREVVSEYKKGEAEKYKDDVQVLRWEFLPQLKNTASMIRRGYKA